MNSDLSAESASPTADARRSKRSASRRPSSKSELTRRNILDAAAKVFAESGYGEGLLTQIARGAGLHVTAFYYYFDTKEALAEALMNDIALRSQARIRERLEALPADASFRDQARTYIGARLEMIVTDHDYLIAHAHILYQVSPDVRERHRRVLKSGLETWESLLAHAVKRGEIRADLDPMLTAMFTIGSVNWAVDWLRPSPIDHRQATDQLLAILFDGLNAQTPNKKAVE